MTAVVLVVGLLILAALFFAVGAPRARARRTVVVERDRPVQRVVQTPVVQTHVVQTPVAQTPVVEEIVEDRY